MSEATYTPGLFVWHEIMTPDVEATKKFYGELLGWTYDEMPMQSGDMYTILKKGEKGMGGIMSLSSIQKEGIPPHWMGYVSSPNVDEAAAAARSNGGTVPMGPQDLPGVGRMAVIIDPHNAATSSWKGTQGDPEPAEQPGVGTFCWDELASSDIDTSAVFYQKVYGWTKSEFEGGGETWVFKAGERPVASLRKTPEGMPPHWLCYVVVEDLAASRDKVTEFGGKILVPSIEVPTVGTLSIIIDNVGAMIGLFQTPAAG